MIKKILAAFSLIAALSFASHSNADISAILLNGVTGTGTHPCYAVGTTLNKSFQITIAGTATVAIEASADNCATTPIPITTVTSTSWISMDYMMSGVRANVTACSGCTVTVKMVAETR